MPILLWFLFGVSSTNTLYTRYPYDSLHDTGTGSMTCQRSIFPCRVSEKRVQLYDLIHAVVEVIYITTSEQQPWSCRFHVQHEHGRRYNTTPYVQACERGHDHIATPEIGT